MDDGNSSRAVGGFTRRKRNESLIRWRKVIQKIAKEGFLKRDDVPQRFVKRLTDPLFVNPPARLYSICGVRAVRRGSVKFSTIDFFGKELSRTCFIVTNEEKFKMWAATYLEAMFRAKNADPDRHLASAFTQYMHDANLHWSGCTEGGQPIQMAELPITWRTNTPAALIMRPTPSSSRITRRRIP